MCQDEEISGAKPTSLTAQAGPVLPNLSLGAPRLVEKGIPENAFDLVREFPRIRALNSGFFGNLAICPRSRVSNELDTYKVIKGKGWRPVHSAKLRVLLIKDGKGIRHVSLYFLGPKPILRHSGC